jgi:hypothetical protein
MRNEIDLLHAPKSIQGHETTSPCEVWLLKQLDLLKSLFKPSLASILPMISWLLLAPLQ